MLICPWPLFTWSWHRNDQFAVLFRHETAARARGATIGVFLLDLNHQLFRRRKGQTQFAGWPVLRLFCFLRLLRRQGDQFNLRNLVSGFPGHHHFVKLQRCRIGAGGIQERFEGVSVLGFESGFVFLRKSFFVGGGRRAETKTRNEQED